MRHLIEQLSGNQPFDPGADYASVLEKVNAGFDHVFCAVAHNPPPGLYIYNSNHINIVCQTCGAFERGLGMIAWAKLFHLNFGQMVDPTNIVVKAFKLWLGFPHYIAGAQAEEARGPLRPKGSSDFSNLVFGLIGILFYIQNMLAYKGNKPTSTIPIQTDFLCNLNIGPAAGPQTWTKHFALLAELVKQVDLQPSKILSFENMCTVARSNYRLVRAIAGGIFNILYSLDCLSVLFNYQPLAQPLAAGMAHTQVLRTFCRRYSHPPTIHNITPQPELFWRNVVQARLTCYNLQGSHNCTAKICPSGNAVFCLGSCQRMHWEEHHCKTCCTDTGLLWGLNGALSIVHLIFICSLVHEQERSTLRLQQSTQQSEGPPPKQFVVLCDLTDAIPNLHEKVYTRGVGKYAHPLFSPDTIAVEVIMNVQRRTGGHRSRSGGGGGGNVEREWNKDSAKLGGQRASSR
ncbi:hypothetical protein EV122DRAFT_295308 [Schizophyllum commune]